MSFPVPTLRHPTGGSFVRPAKVSFGVDYVTAVQQVYPMDVGDLLDESSSRVTQWKFMERRSDDQTSNISFVRPTVVKFEYDSGSKMYNNVNKFIVYKG